MSQNLCDGKFVRLDDLSWGPSHSAMILLAYFLEDNNVASSLITIDIYMPSTLLSNPAPDDDPAIRFENHPFERRLRYLRTDFEVAKPHNLKSYP